ncbi:MAG: diaminopimelate epimerase [candidate division Zixibacteria bacterium]|nr:diaminopimelate epimerase [candidate division Zixibacteria bacterium]
MRKLQFTKMHGLGNDFIFVDGIVRKLPRLKWSNLAVKICERLTGVGADGLILMLPSRKADFRMRIFNSDGSEAEMCGNGFRCMIRYLHDNRYTSRKKIPVQTLAGSITGAVVKSSKSDFRVRVAMGSPEFKAEKIPVKISGSVLVDGKIKIGSDSYIVTAVSMGNPHAVLFMDSLKMDWRSLGAQLELHKRFPERANVEFVKVINRKKIEMISWERGAGPTMASGTGASAAVAAGIKTGRLDHKVEVKFELGSLIIEYDEEENQIYKTGPAEYSFSGTYHY